MKKKIIYINIISNIRPTQQRAQAPDDNKLLENTEKKI